MQYPVQIEQQNGHYHASVLTVPSLTQTASTRDEVLRLIRDDLLEYVKHIDMVYVDIPTTDATGDNPQREDHWLETAGIFADDETLLPLLEDIYTDRANE